jgi:putative tryptophan/tyrosine transport system substrate-binding protein
MKREIYAVALCAMLFALCSFAGAQQQSKNIPRVAYFSLRTASSLAHYLDAFRQALRELEYVEGKNILLEYRFGDGKRDRMPALAAELVSLKVNVIVTGRAGATRPAKEATNTIPIVMAQDTDPLGNGFVASLARPGGNITGLSTLQKDLTGKRLELLKEVVPRLSRVAVIGSSPSADNTRELKETALAAAALGVTIQHFDIRAPKDIEPVFQAAMKPRPDGLFVLINSFERPQNKQVVAFAAKSRLPAMYFSPTLVEDGGLMSYSVNGADLYRRAAVYVDKILRGARPADLPVEQPTKFELVINLKTAKQISLTIPPNVLARADRVIR